MSTNRITHVHQEVQYGSGFFEGIAAEDTANLGSGLTIKAQEFGVAIRSEGFEGVDGILGCELSCDPTCAKTDLHFS